MKKLSLPAFYFFVIMYLELLLRFGIGLTSSWGLFLITTFSLVYALLLHLIERLFPQRFRRVFQVGITLIACLIFGSQYVYYRIFQTFFTLYSMSKSGQIVEFLPDILWVIRTNIAYISLFLVPFIFVLVVKPNRELKVIPARFLVFLLFAVLIVNYSVLNIMREVTNNPKNVYYHNRELVNGIRQLGLLTTMRLDLQRMAGIKMDVPTPPPAPKTARISDDYNILDLKFIDEPGLEDLNAYFSTKEGTRKNEYTGKLAGYNVITIIAESFSHLAIDEELTPTLYRLANDGVKFEHFYNPLWGVSTIDGEYANLTGMLPVAGMWALFETAENSMQYATGHMFDDIGYHSYSFHNHDYHYYGREKIHPNLGYEYIAKGNGLVIGEEWPESDIALFEESLPFYIDDEPFHVNYLTVSGHMMYRFNGNDMADKNHELVKDLDMSDGAKAYLAGQIELDRGVERLVDALTERGIMDHTLIVIAADHYPYGLPHQALEEIAGRRLDKRRDIYESALIMYAKDLEGEIVTKPCSNIDVVPTIYNLLGMKYDSRLFMGSDIFSDAKPLVIFQDRSFLIEEGFYDAVKHKFYADLGSVDQTTINQYREEVDRRFFYSEELIKHDYFRIFKEQ